MKREFSIYLDLIRFLAALVVFIGHLAGRRFTASLFWQVGAFMDAAVIIFFVLSGYVIAYATDARENNARAYFNSRAARIYSVAVPAIVITAILDPVGTHYAPGLYQAWWGYVDNHGLLRAASLLTFTNELWNWHVIFGSLLPYWSLGFEVWYYVLFGIALFCTGWKRLALLGLVALAMGPKILVLFPLWAAGALAYQVGKHGRISRPLGRVLFLASFVLGGLLVIIIAKHLWTMSALTGQLVVQRYVVGCVFLLNILGMQAMAADLGFVLLAIRKPVRYLAGMTFSLYLVHLPVAQFLASVSPYPAASWAERLIILGGTFLIVLVVSHLTERRKAFWRDAIDRMSSVVSARLLGRKLAPLT